MCNTYDHIGHLNEMRPFSPRNAHFCGREKLAVDPQVSVDDLGAFFMKVSAGFLSRLLMV